MTEHEPLAHLVGLIRQCLETSDSAEREKLVQQFQRVIWEESGAETGDAAVDDVLVTAAHDLDFYEPRPDWRAQDASFYDDAELDRRLLLILTDLGEPQRPGPT